MQIRWDEIPADGLFLRIDDDSWVPGNEVTCQGMGTCVVSLKKERGRVLLSGMLHLSLVLDCDRCLDSFAYALAEEFDLVFELLVKDEDAGLVKEYFCKDSDLNVVYLAEPVVDVFAVLTQQVYLGLPDKRLCSENCLGLCPECGTNLNHCPCDCARGTGVSPFSVLSKLKTH